jgi:hypothetical protein
MIFINEQFIRLILVFSIFKKIIPPSFYEIIFSNEQAIRLIFKFSFDK